MYHNGPNKISRYKKKDQTTEERTRGPGGRTNPSMTDPGIMNGTFPDRGTTGVLRQRERGVGIRRRR